MEVIRHRSTWCYINWKRKEDFRTNTLPSVKDFSKVFPDEVPRFPLVREIKFTIDLVPSTVPICLSPYRMSLVELAEY